jgi:hypothetical protein
LEDKWCILEKIKKHFFLYFCWFYL